ncbi:rna-directed dna polymerase from mobile element jockey-like [Willisornis vidua]|uniref:Rna-directed dna polymerase from mobile element jockey-like n=1 Tax=Willisornis vidua TaxID=1566151 RepID=A0ABQ9CTA5_9PASS|nr:rna-directed dna polymerase from mobile element jockey-like [Willisornis vidua]
MWDPCLEAYSRRQGFDGWTTKWIRNWVDSHTQRVVVNGSLSIWGPVRSGVHGGSVLGPILFNIFVSDMHSGIESTLSKFTDGTKLCAISTLEGRDGIQRGLKGLERWVCVNRMKFNMAKWTVLHLGRGNPRHTYRLGREVIESSSAEEDLRVMVGKKLSMTQPCAISAQKAKAAWAAGEGGDYPPLLCPCETPLGIVQYSSGVLNMRGTWICWSKSRGHEVDKRTGSTSPVKTV